METTLSRSEVCGRIVHTRLPAFTTWLTGLSCVAVLFSIAISQILLAGALAVLLLSRRRLDFPPRWRIPLLAFVGWTLLAVAFSDAPVSGLPQVRKLFDFFVLLVVINGFQNQTQIWRTVQGVLLAGVVASVYGLGQFAYDYFALLNKGAGFYENYVVHQITGFMSHWMTYGGQLMIVLLLLLAIILFAADCVSKRWWWSAAVLLSLALLAAFTRGIWLGTLAGTIYLIGRYRRWMLALIPAAILLIYLLSPSWLQRRDKSIFEPQQDSSSRARLVMWRTGLAMIRAHPLFGLGPERVGVLFRRYTPVGVTLPPAWYGHLHDSFLQIAAERGIPCLIILLWLFYEVIQDNLRLARDGPVRQRALGMGAVAVAIGILVAGLFEYNLGDSEVLMLFLFMISVPYAWNRAASNSPTPQIGAAAPLD